MKRRIIPRAKRTISWRTWFIWVDCFLCENQFRREKGSVTYTQIAGGKMLTGAKYVCSTCADSLVDAEEKVWDKIQANRPMPPSGILSAGHIPGAHLRSG